MSSPVIVVANRHAGGVREYAQRFSLFDSLTEKVRVQARVGGEGKGLEVGGGEWIWFRFGVWV